MGLTRRPQTTPNLFPLTLKHLQGCYLCPRLRISTYEQTAKATICGIKTHVNHLGEEHTFIHALMHACTLQVQIPAESPGITQQASESG